MLYIKNNKKGFKKVLKSLKKKLDKFARMLYIKINKRGIKLKGGYMAKKELTKKMKEIFSEQVGSKFKNSDLYQTAEMFILWSFEKNFKNESFNNFCDYIEAYRVPFYDTLFELSGYESILDFAMYWVDKSEIREFLDFCRKEYDYYDLTEEEEKELEKFLED